MTDYTQVTDFSVKDGLTTGDPNKVAKGAHIDDELALISTAITSKANKVTSATANHVATLSGSGDLTSSSRFHPGNVLAISGLRLTPADKLFVDVTGVPSIQCTADTVKVKNTAGEFTDLTSVNVTGTITTSGANGLDTGTEAANTWYFLWVIWNGTTTAALLSTSATAPTMPTGYTHKGLVSAVRNNSASDFLSIRQFGNVVEYDNPQNVLSATAIATFTNLALSSVVPAITQVARLQGHINNLDLDGASSVTLKVRPGGDAGTGKIISRCVTPSATVSSSDVSDAIVITDTSQQIEYDIAFTGTRDGGSVDINVIGFFL